VLTRQPIWIFFVADMTGLSDVIPGRVVDANFEIPGSTLTRAPE
jgi:hypothetical protein